MSYYYRNKSAVNLIRLAGRRLFSSGQPQNPPNGNQRLSNESLQSKADIYSEKYRAVTLISLNRPDKQNALNKSMLSGLAGAIRDFDSDPNSSVAILCGVGGNFSVGYDLDELSAAARNGEDILENITITQNLTEKPIICCISGYCLSLALELALMCDIRFAEESAVMQFSNRQLGLPLVNGGVQRLAQLVGVSRAADLTLSGRVIKGKEANEIGLTSNVVTDGTCLGQALSTALYMSTFPQSSLKYDKRNLYSPSAPICGTIDALPADVLDDIRTGLESELSEKKFAYRGSKRATRKFQVERLAKWEQDEYAREIVYMKKTGNVPQE